MYEPHLFAFHYGPEIKSDSHHPTSENTYPEATFEAADERLLAQYDGFDALFAKDQAYYVEGNYEKYIHGSFRILSTHS